MDRLYGETRFADSASNYLGQIRLVQEYAPFGDGRGLVASTVADGDAPPPIDQGLTTPFQNIPERVGLAATTWAVFAERNFNPLSPDVAFQIVGARMAGTNVLISFNSLAGRTYRIESSTNLFDWSLLKDNIPGTGAVMEIGDLAASAAERRFYRVAENF